MKNISTFTSAKHFIRNLLLLCTTLVMSTAIHAAKPVDSDGDGYHSKQDCNDSDASVWTLNSCGLCEVEPSGGCDGPTCTDSDGDTYAIEGDACGPIDCDDNDPLINPGVSEVCGNNTDENCDTIIVYECPTDQNHGNLAWNDYPFNCITCHDGQDGNQFHEVVNSTHYKWLGDTPDMVNGGILNPGNDPTTMQGKLTNAVNSYCINIEGDWPVCGSCHVGRGAKPEAGNELNEKANVDCLMCHNADYAKNRVRLADGSMGPAAGTPQATLDGYVQNISPPSRTNCLKCHAYAGGGDGVKRGDLSWATATNTNAHFDVHMNSAGANLQCQDCHVFQNHKTIGKGSDLRPTDDLERGAEITCANANCHTDMDSGSGHASKGRRSEPDRHVARVACQSCHIPLYAKTATEMHRDWRSHHDGTDASNCDPANGEVPCPGHPHTDKLANQVPEYKFWNRKSDNYLLGDVAEMDPNKGTYPTSRPLGDIHDGKLTPFKYKTADQPMTTASQLIALDTLEYLKKSGDVELSVNSGLSNMGLSPTAPYTWVTTDTYQMINHGVNPASDVADCSQCHGNGVLDVDSDSMLDLMGYKLKGPKEQVCNQCHDGSKKLPRTWDKMHNHTEKGNFGIGCYFCHEFKRPERGLCDACDPSCSSAYVDNVEFPHECGN
jgi:hypothetical protein